jgi:hypothetical protein
MQVSASLHARGQHEARPTFVVDRSDPRSSGSQASYGDRLPRVVPRQDDRLWANVPALGDQRGAPLAAVRDPLEG